MLILLDSFPTSLLVGTQRIVRVIYGSLYSTSDTSARLIAKNNELAFSSRCLNDYLPIMRVVSHPPFPVWVIAW